MRIPNPFLAIGKRRKKLRHIQPRTSTLPRLLRRIWIALILLLSFVLLGTVGFWLIDDRHLAIHSPGDALYMTLITITTVGYGEVIPLHSIGDRIFAGLIALGGFGTITFLFTSLSVFFLEADLDHALRRRRMEKTIAKLKGHYIVCGFGRVGRNVAQELEITGRRFVVIDRDDDQLISQLERHPQLLYLAGDASDDDLLLAADISDAAGVFAVTGDDSLNLMISLTAKQLNPDLRVVARCHEVRNIEKIRKAGADAIVSPDFTGGMRIVSAMIRPHVVSFLDEMLRTEHRLRVEEIQVPMHAATNNWGVLKHRGEHYVLLAVRDEKDWSFNPSDDYILQSGQTIIAMASPEGRLELQKALGSQV
jgi:voltage-gated potassium channel